MKYEVIYGTKQRAQVEAMFGEGGTVAETHPDFEFVLVMDQLSESDDVVLRPAIG